MTAADSRARFEAGLRLQHLEPDSLLVFVRRLPARMAEAIELPDLGKEPGDDEVVDGLSRYVDQSVERLEEMQDHLSRLIDRLRAVGYPPRTGVEASTPELDVAPAYEQIRGALHRVETAATETAALVAGIPLSGWSEHPDLLDAGRAVVAEISWQLRQLGAERNRCREEHDNQTPEHPEPSPPPSD